MTTTEEAKERLGRAAFESMFLELMRDYWGHFRSLEQSMPAHALVLGSNGRCAMVHVAACMRPGMKDAAAEAIRKVVLETTATAVGFATESWVLRVEPGETEPADLEEDPRSRECVTAIVDVLGRSTQIFQALITRTAKGRELGAWSQPTAGGEGRFVGLLAGERMPS